MYEAADRNMDIRSLRGKIPYWMIAEELKVSETTLLRWLRYNLDENEERKARIIVAIRSIQKNGGNYICDKRSL